MKYAVVGLMLALTTGATAAPLKVRIIYGLDLPPGWVDGMIYSDESRAACQRVIDQMKRTGGLPLMPMLRCVVPLPVVS